MAYLAEQARPSPLAFNKEETLSYLHVLAKHAERNRNCCRELFFGAFFDGTNNNRDRDRPRKCHSNVARLFDTFPQNQQSDGFFPIYAPGVGTKFDDIGDTGAGDDLVWGETDRRRGLAFAEKGEARIVWALLTVLNNLNIAITKRELLDYDQIKKFSNDLTEANAPLWMKALNPAMAAAAQWVMKRQLIDAHRTRVLGDLCRQLEKNIKPYLKRDPVVLGIRFSVFGFSRGAAEARAFSNWFVQMCQATSGGMSLAGLPVDFDFLGLFDTVASVGLANSTIVADGHMEWADAATNLRVPDAVKRCLHLVSAHEVRRSFPLDSVVSGNCTEVVYPGVHSDVGGGYAPREQGRGTDACGDDLLSRVALAQMYREARLANVPLDVDGKGVTAEAKAALAVAASTRDAFNAYLAVCKVKTGSLAEILDEQTRLYARWRRVRLDSMGEVASVQRATPQDRTDILEANKELVAEVKLLQAPVSHVGLSVVAPLPVTILKIGYKLAKTVAERGVDPHHHEDWKRLKPDWDSVAPLPTAVSRLFEDWVHDSRAWFKPFGDDDRLWDEKQGKRMRELDKRQQAMEKRRQEEEALRKQIEARRSVQRKNLSGYKEMPAPQGYLGGSDWQAATDGFQALSESEKRELDEWKKTGHLPPQSSGREPFTMGGGYLRYRRIYYGSDANIVAMGVPGNRRAAA